MTDATHDPTRMSWVASANGHAEYPIQNLPFGVFSMHDGRPRGGVAIGDSILDIGAALGAGLFSGTARDAAEAAVGPVLNPLLALPANARTALRRRLSDILAADSDVRGMASRLLHDAAACTMHLPATIGDYTDFFAGIHHARKGGQISRPDNPLMPNYKYVPVAYHSRASSVRPSGEDVRRPNGQRKLPAEAAPTFGPCRNLDYELELGVWVGAGNRQDEPIPIGEAAEHIAGFCLLNDWSARDIQSWESQPLGPFLGKSFRTSVSPWIITAEAMQPFRIAQPLGPTAIRSRCRICSMPPIRRTARSTSTARCCCPRRRCVPPGAEPHRLCRSNTRDLYWTVAQMVAHHASNGCNLRPGDLFGSGTISGTDADSHRLPAGNDLRRPRHDHAEQRRNATLSGGRR